MVPKAGLEPAQLSLPPPQDGVSTISPLRQRKTINRKGADKVVHVQGAVVHSVERTTKRALCSLNFG